MPKGKPLKTKGFVSLNKIMCELMSGKKDKFSSSSEREAEKHDRITLKYKHLLNEKAFHFPLRLCVFAREKN
jgi:hypothetical protein